jgi:hypothetical protein
MENVAIFSCIITTFETQRKRERMREEGRERKRKHGWIREGKSIRYRDMSLMRQNQTALFPERERMNRRRGKQERLVIERGRGIDEGLKRTWGADTERERKRKSESDSERGCQDYCSMLKEKKLHKRTEKNNKLLEINSSSRLHI